MTHPIVERILRGEVAPNIKEAAARGAIPIPREDLIELWVLLRTDTDDVVRLACKESIAGVPEREWVEILPAHPFDPRVLDFAVRILGKNPAILQAALQNRGVPAATLEVLARQAAGTTVELMMENQVRLIQDPSIVVALLRNPGLTNTQLRRLYDMAEQFFRDHAEIPGLLEQRLGLKLGVAGGSFEYEEGRQEVEEPEGEADAFPEAEVELLPPPPEGEEGTIVDIPVEAITEDMLTTEEFKSLFQKILRMSVPAKIDMAQKGNKEARTLLIRDSNKIVQMAVLDSPKITEAEVEAIAKMRNVTDDILRKVARDREWMKKYGIVRALATNPKTPSGVAMTLVPKLVDFDLKMLIKDKNVSEVIRREAKKLNEARHAKKEVSYKKK